MEKFIPEEIIIDIFSRLPFESILDCRRVSKTWRILIYHPSFAHLHLRRTHSLLQLDDDDDDDDDDHNAAASSSSSSSSSSSKVSFLSLNMLEGVQAHSFQLVYLDYYDENDHEQSSNMKLTKINHPPIQRIHYEFKRIDGTPFWKLQSTTAMIGSCNGLICFSIPRHDIFGRFDDPLYICNPITREYVNLPIFSEKCSEGRVVFGFGYHSKANEYKVVKIYYDPDQPSVGRVQIYTLGAGSGWRNKGEIAYSLLPNNSLSPGVYADGQLYWGTEEWFKIVGFDLADEEFWVPPLPPCFFRFPAVFLYYQIQVLGGCLCFLHKRRYEIVEIWSFKKRKSSYNMKDKDYQSWSWGMECTMQLKDMHVEVSEPFHITKSGEVLLWYRKSTVFRYDPKTSTLEKLVDHGTGLDIFETIPHVNSFVSLKALGEENVQVFNPIN